VEGEGLAVRGVTYSQLNNGTSGFNGTNKDAKKVSLEMKDEGYYENKGFEFVDMFLYFCLLYSGIGICR